MTIAALRQTLIWRLEAQAFVIVSRLLRLLPLDAASAFGGWLLRVLGPLTRVNRTVERNLRLAFPALSDAERDKIRRAQWENVGRYFVEFTMMDRLTPASGRIEVQGWERLREIAERGAPVVFVSGHLSNIEIMAAVIMAAKIDCVITFRAANNPYFNQAMIESRRRYGVKLFAPKGDGARDMLEALEHGRSVALLNDQKDNRGVSAPFFDQPANTASGPTRLALRAGGVLQPLSVQRLKGARFRVIAHEPIRLAQTGDRKADVEAGVRAINAFVEARVRERPEEWFWVHKRWADKAYASLKD
jgi:KDO2-lipid IV(A) lauroyltransferase